MIRSKGVTFRSGGEVKQVKGVHKIEELGHIGVLEKISCYLMGELKFAMLSLLLKNSKVSPEYKIYLVQLLFLCREVKEARASVLH